MSRIRLHSPLAPVALATRLKEVVPDTIGPDTQAQVIGRGSEQSMALWYYRPRVANSFRLTLVATIAADRDGSVVAGRIGMARGVVVFMACWMAFVVLFGLTFGGLVVGLHAPRAMVAGFVGIPLAMSAIGVAMIAWARRIARQDRAAMLDFLARTIDARMIERDR